jgi:CheY-like chemotaxis protein
LLDISGLEVARRLRRASGAPGPPIVLFTFNPISLDAKLRDDLGIVATLRGPLGSVILIAAVETSLVSSAVCPLKCSG